jgi:HAD superfamily hydrolase (TIGR01450 family)
MDTDGTGVTGHKGTIVFDLDGVVYLGHVGIPGAGAALEAVSAMGWHLIFATNNSTRSPGAVLDRIEHLTGFRAEDVDVVTSGMAAAAWTARKHRRVFLVGEEGLRDTLTGAGLEIVDDDTAEAVIVGLDRGISYDSIATASRLVRNGATYVATNTDATFPTPSGPVPGAGSIVAAITTASGRAPISCGKPEEPMVDLVRSRVRGARVWVVGDRPETDLAMARRAGWSGVLVLTGVTNTETTIPADHTPDHTLESVSAVPALLAAHDHIGRHDEG